MSNRIPNKPGKYKQGRYSCQNPDKYLGDLDRIYYRSSWEQKLYYYLDVNNKILKWSAEGIKIPYEIYENGNTSTHSYFPDTYCEVQMPNGDVNRLVLEIKPWSEYRDLKPPKEPKTNTAKALKNYEYALRTFHKNIVKWGAAKEFCDRRGIEFFVITEKYFDDDSKIKLF